MFWGKEIYGHFPLPKKQKTFSEPSLKKASFLFIFCSYEIKSSFYLIFNRIYMVLNEIKARFYDNLRKRRKPLYIGISKT